MALAPLGGTAAEFAKADIPDARTSIESVGGDLSGRIGRVSCPPAKRRAAQRLMSLGQSNGGDSQREVRQPQSRGLRGCSHDACRPPVARSELGAGRALNFSAAVVQTKVCAGGRHTSARAGVAYSQDQWSN